MLTPEHLEAFEKLRRQAIPGDEETEVLVQKAVDVNYWRSLNVELEVMSDHSEKMADAVRVSEEEQLQAAHHLVEHGYFRLPPSCDSQLIARMRTGVEAVRKAGWPAVFSYVYDEFWAIFRQPPVVRLLKSYLGEKYQQSADFWTYYVDPKAHGSGWSPHVDSPQTDRRMAIWFPLSDATVDNGCIYVVPQDRVPPSLPVKFGKWDFISRKDLETLFHGVTPLPAKAGSILGWNHRLIHWGGRPTSPGSTPRISIAAEFLDEKAIPAKGELPVFAPNLAPDFPLRIQMIAKLIIEYWKFEPSLWKFVGLAEKLQTQ